MSYYQQRHRLYDEGIKVYSPCDRLDDVLVRYQRDNMILAEQVDRVAKQYHQIKKDIHSKSRRENRRRNYGYNALQEIRMSNYQVQTSPAKYLKTDHVQTAKEYVGKYTQRIKQKRQIHTKKSSEIRFQKDSYNYISREPSKIKTQPPAKSITCQVYMEQETIEDHGEANYEQPSFGNKKLRKQMYLKAEESILHEKLFNKDEQKENTQNKQSIKQKAQENEEQFIPSKEPQQKKQKSLKNKKELKIQHIKIDCSIIDNKKEEQYSNKEKQYEKENKIRTLYIGYKLVEPNCQFRNFQAKSTENLRRTQRKSYLSILSKKMR